MRSTRSKKTVVYENIKKRIINNLLKSGEPLNEIILAHELKTSKTPIREAFQQLERDGFVENIPGKGCFVSRISFQDVKELFEIREILECEVIRRAAMKGDLERISEIRREFEFSENNGGRSLKDQFKAGDRIHTCIFESFGNKRLCEFYNRMQEHVERMRIHFFNQTHEERWDQSYKEHLEILDALVARDPLRAENAVKTHLRNAMEFLKQVI